jgi:hypothetical protein
MWHATHGSTILGPEVDIVSTWHLGPTNESIVTPDEFSAHWLQDFKEIRQADALLAYAEAMDKPQGTLVEIGYALSQEMPVYLVGNYPWASWKFHPLVTHHATLREAVLTICRSTVNDPT